MFVCDWEWTRVSQFQFCAPFFPLDSHIFHLYFMSLYNIIHQYFRPAIYAVWASLQTHISSSFDRSHLRLCRPRRSAILSLPIHKYTQFICWAPEENLLHNASTKQKLLHCRVEAIILSYSNAFSVRMQIRFVCPLICSNVFFSAFLEHSKYYTSNISINYDANGDDAVRALNVRYVLT